MLFIVRTLLAFFAIWVHSRMSLQLEIIALRYQLAVYLRPIRRPLDKNWRRRGDVIALLLSDVAVDVM